MKRVNHINKLCYKYILPLPEEPLKSPKVIDTLVLAEKKIFELVQN